MGAVSPEVSKTMILQAKITRTARSALARSLEAGAAAYDRRRMLPRLIAAGPDLVGDETPEGRLRVIRLLGRALRGERCRGRAGHWTYSLDRHIGLVQAIRAEGRALAALRQG